MLVIGPIFAGVLFPFLLKQVVKKQKTLIISFISGGQHKLDDSE